MRVPWLASHEDLDEAHAPLHQPTSHQAAFAIGTRFVSIQAVELLSRRGLLLEVQRVGGGKLHSRGEFEAGDAGVQFEFAGSRLPMPLVERSQ